MQQVGFLYEVEAGVNPIQTMGCSRLYRAIEMSKYLSQQDVRLLIYSPVHVDQATHTVRGYYLQDQQFHEVTTTVPRVNANWHFGKWRAVDAAGNKQKSFKVWTVENDIQIYLPWSFKDIIDDKKASYEAVAQFDQSLMPYSELCQYQQAQIERFLENSDLIFLKPFYGSKGRRIMVVRKIGKRFKLSYYNTDETHIIARSSLKELFIEIERYVDKENVMIQQGVDTVKFNGSSFDIRVIMLHDGKDCHCLHHIWIGPSGSDLSYNLNEHNVFASEFVLSQLFGPEKCKEIIAAVTEKSYRLYYHLDQLAPGQIMELAYDFIVDQQGNVFLAETNSQPGLWYDKPFQNIFKLSPEDQNKYDQQIAPHGKYLGMYLHHQLQRSLPSV